MVGLILDNIKLKMRLYKTKIYKVLFKFDPHDWKKASTHRIIIQNSYKLTRKINRKSIARHTKTIIAHSFHFVLRKEGKNAQW